LAVDEVVEGKSGRHSHGLAKFYSSCSQKSIQGICFFALSLIKVRTKQSFLLNSLQVVYSQEDKQRIAAKKEKTKLGKIYPKGEKQKKQKKI
jgi:putative transposase